MAKQPTKSSARTSTKSPAENNDPLPNGVINTTSTASASSEPDVLKQTDGHTTGASDNNLENPSQGDADGAGANAGSVEQQTALDNIFSATGAATLAELVSLCAIGRNVILAIESVCEDDPTLQKWLSDENPCGIIGELAAENAALNDLLDSRTAVTIEPEKRRFVVERDVRLDNVLLEAGEISPLTRKQHADVVAADACATRWEDGAEI